MSTFFEAIHRQEIEKLERDVRARRTFPQPDRITAALDLCQLYGPEVDEACLAREPDVDNWEAGRSAPSWEQLRALAELTGFAVTYFFKEFEHAADGHIMVCGRGGCQSVPIKHVEPFDPGPRLKVVPLTGQRSLF